MKPGGEKPGETRARKREGQKIKSKGVVSADAAPVPFSELEAQPGAVRWLRIEVICCKSWVCSKKESTMATACIDHEGNKFRSVYQMCKAWGVNPSLYTYRRDRGMSLEEALTTPSRRSGSSKPCVDHLGNEYPNVTAMCKAWGTTDGHYRRALARGLSLEEILTQGGVRKEPLVSPAALESEKAGERPRPGRKGKPCTDHTGREFPSEKAMCIAWGMDQTTFRARIRTGWDLEHALEFPVWSGGGKRDMNQQPPENRRRIHEETIKAGPKVESLYGKKEKEQPKEEKAAEGQTQRGEEKTGQGEEQRRAAVRQPGVLKSAPNKPKMKASTGSSSVSADYRSAAKSAAALAAVSLDAPRALKQRGA